MKRQTFYHPIISGKPKCQNLPFQKIKFTQLREKAPFVLGSHPSFKVIDKITSKGSFRLTFEKANKPIFIP